LDRDLYFFRFPVGHVYVWRDPDGLTLIDAGAPGSAEPIAGAIRGLGHDPGDVRRLVLTHGHVDHVGGAAEIAAWGEVTVFAHHADAPVIRGQEVLGDNQYGGRDRDAVISGALADRLDRQGVRVPADGTARRRLEVAAEYLEVGLSTQTHADYLLRGFADGTGGAGGTGRTDVRLELSRAELAEILAESSGTLRAVCERFTSSMPGRPDHPRHARRHGRVGGDIERRRSCPERIRRPPGCRVDRERLSK
jgi:hypothetical protein